MMKYARSAVVAVVLSLGAACAPDAISPSNTALAPGDPRRATAPTTEAAPVSLVLTPDTVYTSSIVSVVGDVRVASAASVDRTIQVATDHPALLVPLSSSITVAAGTTTATLRLLPQGVTVPTVVVVSVTGNGVTVSGNVLIQPAGTVPPPPALASISVSPLTVNAGTTATGTVTLTNPAPAGGAVVDITTNLPLSDSVPGPVTVPAGATSVSFPILTFPGFPNSTTTPRIIGTYLGSTVTTGVNIVTGTVTSTTPTTLSLLSLTPTSVTGGGTVQGQVMLSGAAPSGGAVVTLASSNAAVATPPASVTIAAGASGATFTVRTSAVTSAASPTISATYAGFALAMTLTVNPGTPTGGTSGPLAAPSLVSPAADARFAPGQVITFDWSDVPTAASYTIQIDNKDTFPTPYVVNQTVSASQLALGTLPTQTMWFRVRANAADGTPGAWSSIRRFEVKQ